MVVLEIIPFLILIQKMPCRQHTSLCGNPSLSRLRPCRTFKLFYKATTTLCLACSVVASSKQFFGDPINCEVVSDKTTRIRSVSQDKIRTRNGIILSTAL